MKFPLIITIVFIVYISNFYTLALPIDLTDALNENVYSNKKISTMEDLLPSGKYNPEHMGGHYQGDMILPEEVLRGAASRPSWQRWPNGVIPYDIRPSISANHTLLILDSMRQMESLTQVNDTPCIQFRPKTDNDSIFITIQNGTGCSAYVGYLQNYTLNRIVTLMHAPPYTCMITGIVQHELIHVLGFYHEQARPDRDDYVSIQWENIAPGVENNFEKYSEENIDTLMTPYDYGSVMHYDAYSFTINGLPTIIPTRNSSAVIGQRIGMSPIDILEIQRYYGCLPTVTSSSTISTTTTTTTSSAISTSTTSSLTTTATTSSSTATASSSITTSTTSSSSAILPEIVLVLLFTCAIFFK